MIHKGIPDPLRQLESMHVLLDAVEVMILEGMEDKDRDAFRFKHYMPDPEEAVAVSREDELDSFDAFMAAAGA